MTGRAGLVAVTGGSAEPAGEAPAGNGIARTGPVTYSLTGNVVDGPPAVVVPQGLEGLLSTSPCFRPSLRGYDRIQVDDYVAWAETELSVARRQVDDLLARLGACAAELDEARRAAADRDGSGLPAPLVDLLRRAADEARRTTDEAAAEADRILADARLEADARLRKADAIVEAAAAAANERLAMAEREVEELRKQRDEARESLRRLTSRIGEALQGVVLLADDGRMTTAG